jgi:adenylate cyclase
VQAGDREDPGITLLEDLHWFDEGSEAFLEAWVDALAGTRGLLIVNFRPEYRAEWMQSSHYQQIALQPLGPEAIRELLDDLLGGHPSIVGLADAIHERTRGNPFFTEEVVRTLIEDGHLEGARGAYRLVTPVAKLQVPDSVHSVLAARIDHLAEREKQLLQIAAVIGKNFEEPILEAVADLPKAELADALAALRNAEFVYEESLYPVVEYAFRHPLTQEVALHSQLTERRGQLHAAVARAIEELKADELDEQAALLAHHWEQAGELLEAARWAGRAAEWAGVRDVAEFVRLWRKARELAAAASESEGAVELRMRACLEILNFGAWRVGMPLDEVEALYAEGKRLAEERGDRHYLAAVEAARLPIVGLLSGDVDGYARGALEAARLAEEVGDLELQVTAGVLLGYSHFLIGRLDDALRHTRRLRELTDRDPELGRPTFGFSARLWAQVHGALLEAVTGRIPEGLRRLEGVARAAREAGETEVVGMTLSNIVEVLTLHCGELGDAPGLAREALEAAQKLGTYYFEVHSVIRMAEVQMLQEEWEAAVDSMERALAISREHRTAVEQEPAILARLAEAHLGGGDWERAAALAQEAISMARSRGARLAEVVALLARARSLLAGGDPAGAGEIEECLDAASAIVEESGYRVRAPTVLEERARLARVLGDPQRWERHLREAHRLYSEMGATGHARRLAGELGS